MKKLSDHNKTMYDKIPESESNAGVLCNACGCEMVYAGSITHMSYPPQRKVACPYCGRSGVKVI